MFTVWINKPDQEVAELYCRAESLAECKRIGEIAIPKKFHCHILQEEARLLDGMVLELPIKAWTRMDDNTWACIDLERS